MRGLVPKDYQKEIAYGISNSHETDDVPLHREVKLVTSIRLETISKSKTAGDAI